MHLMYYLDADGKRVYTLKKETPAGEPTYSAHPARFSPDDKFSKQRVSLKKRFVRGQLPEPYSTRLGGYSGTKVILTGGYPLDFAHGAFEESHMWENSAHSHGLGDRCSALRMARYLDWFPTRYSSLIIKGEVLNVDGLSLGIFCCRVPAQAGMIQQLDWNEGLKIWLKRGSVARKPAPALNLGMMNPWDDVESGGIT